MQLDFDVSVFCGMFAILPNASTRSANAVGRGRWTTNLILQKTTSH